MRVLYVAPRYHTNQIPIVKGWLDHGDQVMFISQNSGTPEDYSVLKPVILGYSYVFEVVARIYRTLFCREEKSDKKEFDFRIKVGFPPLGSSRKYVSIFKPDVAILRERSVYNIPFCLMCRKKNIPCILYNQSPLWDKPKSDRGILKWIFLNFLPEMRMTPVMGIQGHGNVEMVNTVYVPFVIEPRIAPNQKGSFQSGRVNLICVGRYEERKNLMMLVKVLDSIKEKYDFSLVVIGEYQNEGQKEYYKKLETMIATYDMCERIRLLKNLNMDQMYDEYRKADLFVLPSTRERASVSQLEAMSCSLPVVCSNTNGTANYVQDGVNGFLFRDNDADDLRNKLEMLLSDRGKLLEMGKNSYMLVCDKYQFIQYYEKIREIIRDIDFRELSTKSKEKKR